MGQISVEKSDLNGSDLIGNQQAPSRTFRCHDLRHSFAIRWLQRGCDIYALARHLGHASVKTTEGYTKWLSTGTQHRHSER